MSLIDNWKEEKRSAYLYRIVASCEAGTAREGLFKQLAVEAESQAEIWVGKMRQEGGTPPVEYVPYCRFSDPKNRPSIDSNFAHRNEGARHVIVLSARYQTFCPRVAKRTRG